MRTNLVYLSDLQSLAGDVIVDELGKNYPSQRLSDGRLFFLAKAIPSLGSKNFFNQKGKVLYNSDLKIGSNVIENGYLRLVIDEKMALLRVQ